MIQIQISRINARGTTDPWDVASASVHGTNFTERSRSSAIAKLARTLVAAGIPDQPWQTITPHGTVSLRGRSLHAIAKTTITESDKGGLQQRMWAPHPAGGPKDGAEARTRVKDTDEDLEAAGDKTGYAQMGV